MEQFHDRDPLPGVREAAMRRVLNSSVLDRIKRDPSRAYEMRVFFASSELTSLFEELEATLALMSRAHTFPELSSLLKLYVIGWNSLSDLLAIVLNEVYDLGTAEHDVSFGNILRNRHMTATDIPNIVKRYAKEFRYDHFASLRNDIVHRGKLDDKELENIRHDLLMNLFAVSSQLSAADAAAKRDAVAAARDKVRVEARIRQLVAKRQAEYAEHLGVTRQLLRDIAAIVVLRIGSQPV